MSKSDLSWVLVKFLGVVLLYFGIASIYGALIALVNLQDLLDTLPKSQRGNVSAPIFALIFGALMPLALGTYLVVSGRSLHGILMSVPSGAMSYSPNPGDISGVDLPEAELAQFKVWLKLHPEFSRRPPVDQIALFRDAQAEEPK